MIKKFVCSIVVGILLVSNALAVELNVPLYGQEKSNWCWVASSQMVAGYKGYRSKTQTQICTYVKGGAVNDSGSIAEVADAIFYASNGNLHISTATAAQFPLANIKSAIDKSNPVTALVNKSGSGHYYVIRGYNGSTLLLNDPLPLNSGKRVSCTYTAFCNGSWSGDNRPYAYACHIT